MTAYTDFSKQQKDKNMILSIYHVAIPIDNGTQMLLHSFISGETLKISLELYECLQKGDWSTIPTDILEILVSSRIVSDGSNEFPDYDAQSETLYVALLPNSRCQLSCKYCGQQKLGHEMTEITQIMTLKFIKDNLNNNKYRHLKISWFGGEPALNVNIVREMSLSLISMAKEYGCTYSSEIVTNGIALSNETCDILVKDCQIGRFEITLDGFLDNERRVNAAGKGFYNEIVTNIQYLVTLPCLVTIRCNVDIYNKQSIFPMMEHFQRIGLHDKVDFYLAMVHSWGCETGSSALEAMDFAKFQVSVFEFMYDNGFRLTIDTLLPHREFPRMCIHQRGENCFLVDTYGLIYTCSEEPYTRTPEAIAGHVSTGRKQFYPRFQLNGKQLAYCQMCKVWPVCGGGCVKRYCEHGKTECVSLLYNMEERAILAYKLINSTQNTTNMVELQE